MPTRFDSMNRDELRAACRVAKITGYSKLTLGEMRARLWDVEPLEFALVRPSRDAQAYESFAVVGSPDFAALEAAGTLVHRFTAQNRSNITLRLEGAEVVVVVDNMLVHRTSVADWAWRGDDSDTRRQDVQNEPRTRERGRRRRVPSHLRTPARRARFEQRELERQARAAQQGEYSGVPGQ
jgi:hypothetical protein